MDGTPKLRPRSMTWIACSRPPLTALNSSTTNRAGRPPLRSHSKCFLGQLQLDPDAAAIGEIQLGVRVADSGPRTGPPAPDGPLRGPHRVRVQLCQPQPEPPDISTCSSFQARGTHTSTSKPARRRPARVGPPTADRPRSGGWRSRPAPAARRCAGRPVPHPVEAGDYRQWREELLAQPPQGRHVPLGQPHPARVRPPGPDPLRGGHREPPIDAATDP